MLKRHTAMLNNYLIYYTHLAFRSFVLDSVKHVKLIIFNKKLLPTGHHITRHSFSQRGYIIIVVMYPFLVIIYNVADVISHII